MRDARLDRMANQHGNGRHTAMSQENPSGWRPQDDNGMRHRRTGGRERDYGDEERFAVRERERMGAQWDDRSARWDDRRNDPEDRHRSTEYNGQGQSGYGAGRHEADRAFNQRNERYATEEEYRDRGTDDRFTGRGGYGGGSSYSGGYGSAGNMGAIGNSSQRQQGTQGYTGGHRGKGPSTYQRSDERIREIVCEVLTENDHVDATNIDVTVKNGEVTLSGTVEDRSQKRIAGDIVENLSCVHDVINQLRFRS